MFQMQASAKIDEDPHYQKSSHNWNDIQWNSVNKPNAPPPVVHIRSDPMEQSYINYNSNENHQPPKMYLQS